MTIPHTKPGESSLPQAAALMTYAGSLPPIISVIFLWLRPNDYGVDAKAFLILYGGILLTFFGGVRWGVAVMRDSGPNFMNLFGGIWPILVAIPVFFLENNLIRFLIIITVLPLLLWDDLRETREGSGAPNWYLGVRMPLTIIMETAFILAAIATLIN